MREWGRKHADRVNARRRERNANKPGGLNDQRQAWCDANLAHTSHMTPTEKRQAYAKAYREANKVKAATANKEWRTKNADKLYEQRQALRHNRPAYVALIRCRKAAKQQGLAFDLEESDIVVPTHCPVFGTPFVITTGKRTDATPSVDRIIPALGYVKGNVIVVSWRANRIKNDATPAELTQLGQFYSSVLYPPA